jgi:hypothetical protein
MSVIRRMISFYARALAAVYCFTQVESCQRSIRSDISDCACSTARGIRARLQPCRNSFAPLC